MTRVYVDGYGMLSGSDMHKHDDVLYTDTWYEHPIFKMNKHVYEYLKEHHKYAEDMIKQMRINNA